MTNVRYPSGAVGCVSNNYPDGKWRIVAYDSTTFPSRDTAARAERVLTEYLREQAGSADSNPARLLYTTPAQAQTAAFYYAQGRQDRLVARHRANSRLDLAVQTRDTDAAETFAEAFAEAFRAYHDQLAGMGVNLETAYDNWTDHGHCRAPGECPKCGFWLGKPTDNGALPGIEQCRRCTPSVTTTS